MNTFCCWFVTNRHKLHLNVISKNILLSMYLHRKFLFSKIYFSNVILVNNRCFKCKLAKYLSFSYDVQEKWQGVKNMSLKEIIFHKSIFNESVIVLYGIYKKRWWLRRLRLNSYLLSTDYKRGFFCDKVSNEVLSESKIIKAGKFQFI